jgi:hypothetical protein
VRFDRIEGREHPHRGLHACRGIGGQQGFRLLPKVQQDGAGFEQRHAVVFQHRHLAERLLLAVGPRRLVFRADQAQVVRQPRFLQRPAHAQVAHVAGGKRRNPFEGGQCMHRLVSSL